MATIHHHHHHHSTPTPTATTPYRPRRHSLDCLSSSSTPAFSTLKHSHFTTFSLSTSASTSASPTIATTPTSPFSLDVLERCLAEANFRQADEETRRLLIVLAGEQTVKRGYVFFSEVQFIPKEDLKAIDNLWLKYSNNRFGYSVQKKIWVKVEKDFTKFFIKVGWMKKLDTEIEQYNYRSFPSEFIWEFNLNNNSSVKRETVSQETTDSSNDVISEVAPEGHLPLTNALRGTQLLNMIFNHPAFDEGNDEEKRNEENNNYVDDDNVVIEEVGKKKSRLASLRDKLFKPNYSF